jgi:ferrous iron transport protein A
MTSPSVPLTQLAPREEGTVAALSGGHGFVSRLATLGFTPGAPLTMVQNFGHGPLIVRVRDTRIALGRGEAGHILVRREAKYA